MGSVRHDEFVADFVRRQGLDPHARARTKDTKKERAIKEAEAAWRQQEKVRKKLVKQASYQYGLPDVEYEAARMSAFPEPPRSPPSTFPHVLDDGTRVFAPQAAGGEPRVVPPGGNLDWLDRDLQPRP
jgi:hypothetical protein